MQQATTTVSRKAAITGLIIGLLPVLFLTFDGVIKVMLIQPVIDSFKETGYPVELARPFGLILLISVILYLIPRTAFFGVILLTAYLGGAVAVQARTENPWFLMPVGLCFMLWFGLWLRSMPLRRFIAAKP